MGKGQEAAGNTLEAKKQYLFAKNLYKELKLDDKVVEVDGLIEVLETTMEQESRKAEQSEAAETEDSSAFESSGETEQESNQEVGPGV